MNTHIGVVYIGGIGTDMCVHMCVCVYIYVCMCIRVRYYVVCTRV